MASAEQGLPDTLARPAREHSARRGLLDMRLPVVVVTVVVLAQIAVPLVRPGWQIFSDPLGLYTLRFPPEWTAQNYTTYATFGDRDGSATDPWESVTFRDPSLGTGSVSVSIAAGPIENTAFEHQWYCQAWPGRDTTGLFHSFPAGYMIPAGWLFETGNAHFQIDVTIPGVIGPIDGDAISVTPKPTATPLSPIQVATDLTDVSGILDTFHPSDLEYLAC